MFLNRIRLFKKKKHLYKIKKSKQVIFKIKKISKSSNGYDKAIMYLRKIDPYVFEELILTVVEQNNIKQWFVFNLLPSGRGAKNYNELSISNVNELKQKLKALKNKKRRPRKYLIFMHPWPIGWACSASSGSWRI